MASVNKVILLGNCGRDPEVRYLPSGMAIANISIATSSKRKDKNTGETIEETQWHRVQFFDKLAGIVGEYVRKGSQIYVEGRLQTRKWTDKDGQEKYSTEIRADNMQMLGAKPERQDAPTPRQQAPQKPVQSNRAPVSQSGFEDMDDDIPF